MLVFFAVCLPPDDFDALLVVFLSRRFRFTLSEHFQAILSFTLGKREQVLWAYFVVMITNPLYFLG